MHARVDEILNESEWEPQDRRHVHVNTWLDNHAGLAQVGRSEYAMKAQTAHNPKKISPASTHLATLPCCFISAVLW